MKKIICLLLVLHLFLLSRLQFTAWPEMISFPYFLNHGFVTYRDMIYVYPPLLINVLALLYKIFGYNLLVLKAFTWSLLLTNDLLLFFIVKKITKRNVFAFLSLALYIPLQSVLEGNMLWPDIAIVPFLLLGFLFLLNKKFLLAGLAIGLACLTKQTGAIYLVSSLPAIAWSRRRLQAGILYLSGFVLVLVPLLINLINSNSLSNFLNWVFLYPSRYWTKFPGYVQMIPTKRELVILLILFTPLLLLLIKLKKKFFSKDSSLILLFLLSSCLAVYPRFSFFHFQSALAFLIILYSTFFPKFRFLNHKSLIVAPLVMVILLYLPASLREALPAGGYMAKSTEARFWAQSDIKLAQIILSTTPSNQSVYLLGLPSSMYVFADRVPPKPWLDNFGWYLEIPGVQQQVIEGFKKDMPSAIFWQTPGNGDWYDIGVYQPKEITDFIEQNYAKQEEVQTGIWLWVRK